MDAHDHVGAQPPPPPEQDAFPTGALVVVVDDLDHALLAAQAATALSASVPYIIEADEVLSERIRRHDRQGPLKRLYLALGAMVSDQQGIETHYVEEARLGHHLVIASAGDAEQADKIWAALKAYGAHDGTWNSRWSLRELL